MKKASVSGKGGTGKSVIVTLLTNVLSENGYTVLTLDSDESNPGLYQMLGFDTAPRPLISLFGGKRRVDEIVDRVSLAGGSEELASQELAKTLTWKEISLQDIPDKYFVERGNIKLMTVGKITAAFEGCACPMGVVSKLFLERLALKENEIALADMEAGVEHFGRGVESGIDTVLIAVEPSFESMALAAKINWIARKSKLTSIYAIINKVPSQAIEDKLREELTKREVKIIGAIPYDLQVSEACLEGKPLGESGAKEAMRKVVAALLQQ